MAKQTLHLANKEDVDKLKNPEFEVSENRTNIKSGEDNTSILGKIMKFFTDLKAHAFNDTANNLTTTEEGYALDARQGKVLSDKIETVSTFDLSEFVTNGNVIRQSVTKLGKNVYLSGIINGVSFTTCDTTLGTMPSDLAPIYFQDTVAFAYNPSDLNDCKACRTGINNSNKAFFIVDNVGSAEGTVSTYNYVIHLSYTTE